LRILIPKRESATAAQGRVGGGRARGDTMEKEEEEAANRGDTWEHKACKRSLIVNITRNKSRTSCRMWNGGWDMHIKNEEEEEAAN
jgi:hypothetical protein